MATLFSLVVGGLPLPLARGIRSAHSGGLRLCPLGTGIVGCGRPVCSRRDDGLDGGGEMWNLVRGKAEESEVGGWEGARERGREEEERIWNHAGAGKW